jgi:hypothetical protein
MDKTPKGPISSQKQRRSAATKGKSSMRLVKTPDAASAELFLAKALATLQATQLESKGGRLKDVHDPAVVAAMKAFFPAGKTYEFRLGSQCFPYPTDGSGNLLSAIAFSPAVTTFPEWSGISALFDEVVLRRARVTLVGGASGLKNVGLVVGYNPNNVSATPASTNAVINLANMRLVSSYATTPTLLVMDVKIPKGRAWAETTVPAVASPPAGCVGTFDFANAGASGTISSTYFYAFLEIAVTLRNRI